MPVSILRLKTWIAALVCSSLATCLAFGATQANYLITNDDDGVPFSTGITFFTVGTGGSLTLGENVPTGGFGIGGGYFGGNRIATFNQGTDQCVYASEAYSQDIVGVSVTSLAVGGSATGSDTDSGNTNGIGLVIHGNYLYASFTASNTIGTFQLQSGCSLSFVNDVSVAGLQSGFIDGMAVQGKTLVATYGDGSIESFDISNGTPVSNGDKQNSSGALAAAFASYPTSVEITQDGHYALFGDTSTSSLVEVSDISSGKLTKTVAYNLGHGINSSNILLSPDETLLYVGNTQGDQISAAFFNSTTGSVTYGCSSNRLKGYVSGWSYLATLALAGNAGTGSPLYAAEFGTSSGIAVIDVTSNGGNCSLVESAASPVGDPNSAALLSVAVFPPRSF